MLVSSPLIVASYEARRGEERRDNEKLLDPTQTLQVKVVEWGEDRRKKQRIVELRQH